MHRVQGVPALWAQREFFPLPSLWGLQWVRGGGRMRFKDQVMENFSFPNITSEDAGA